MNVSLLSKRHCQTHVLVITSLFPSPFAPARGIFIENQLKQIKKFCSVPAVISPEPWYSPKLQRHNPVFREQRWNNTAIYRPSYFMLPKMTVYINGLFYFFCIYLLLRKKQQPFRFDLVHAHFAYPAGFAAALLGQIFNKPVVLTVRGSDINLFPTDPALKKLIKYALHHATHIIAVSKDLKSKVIGLGIQRDRISVIPNGVDLHTFRPMARKLARKQLGLATHGNIIIYIGALEPVKGVNNLLHAFIELCNANVAPELILVMVGTGSLQKHTTRLIAKSDLNHRVIFHSYLEQQLISLWLNASNVLCLPSINEGRANVLYEAMACGIPVVATNVGGTPEVVSSNKLGKLIPPQNVRDLKNALADALSEKWDREIIRKQALLHSVTKYSRQVIDIYQHCFDSA